MILVGVVMVLVCKIKMLMKPVLPKEAVNVFEPLGYEVVSNWLSVVGKAEILQSVKEKRGAVVKTSDGHL